MVALLSAASAAWVAGARLTWTFVCEAVGAGVTAAGGSCVSSLSPFDQHVNHEVGAHAVHVAGGTGGGEARTVLDERRGEVRGAMAGGVLVLLPR